MARRSTMAGRAYRFKLDRAYETYRDSIAEGIDPRAALKTYNESLLAAQLGYQGAVRRSQTASATGNNFAATAIGAGMTGAGRMTGTAQSSAVGTGTVAVTPTVAQEQVAQTITTPSQREAAKEISTARKEEKRIEAFVEAERDIQKTLQPIRQRRRRAAEQQASLLRRTTGRRALLVSPAGGAGFFGGYFKG